MSRRARWLAVGLVVVIAAYASAYRWGQGGLGSFSPDTLMYRTQAEWRVPILHLPVYRSSYRYHRPELVAFLVDNDYWSPVESDWPTWMPMFNWNVAWRDGDSSLHKELGRHREKWITWTKDHPEQASALWPWVLETLRRTGDENQVADRLVEVRMEL